MIKNWSEYVKRIGLCLFICSQLLFAPPPKSVDKAISNLYAIKKDNLAEAYIDLDAIYSTPPASIALATDAEIEALSHQEKDCIAQMSTDVEDENVKFLKKILERKRSRSDFIRADQARIARRATTVMPPSTPPLAAAAAAPVEATSTPRTIDTILERFKTDYPYLAAHYDSLQKTYTAPAPADDLIQAVAQANDFNLASLRKASTDPNVRTDVEILLQDLKKKRESSLIQRRLTRLKADPLAASFAALQTSPQTKMLGLTSKFNDANALMVKVQDTSPSAESYAHYRNATNMLAELVHATRNLETSGHPELAAHVRTLTKDLADTFNDPATRSKIQASHQLFVQAKAAAAPDKASSVSFFWRDAPGQHDESDPYSLAYGSLESLRSDGPEQAKEYLKRRGLKPQIKMFNKLNQSFDQWSSLDFPTQHETLERATTLARNFHSLGLSSQKHYKNHAEIRAPWRLSEYLTKRIEDLTAPQTPSAGVAARQPDPQLNPFRGVTAAAGTAAASPSALHTATRRPPTPRRLPSISHRMPNTSGDEEFARELLQRDVAAEIFESRHKSGARGRPTGPVRDPRTPLRG